MLEMKILHCADLHIRENALAEIDGCLQKIVTTAQEELPGRVVIAGDIFDSRDVKLDSQSAITAIGFVSALADICPVAIVIGTPSHDGNAPDIMRYSRGRKYDVTVSSLPEQLYLYQGALYRRKMVGNLQPEAVISMIPQPTKRFFQSASSIQTADQEVGQTMSGLFMGFRAGEYKCPHILVYHGGVSGARLPSGQMRIGLDIEVSTDQMMLASPDLICMGHIHQKQQIGDRSFYSGPIYATKIDEQGPNGFYIHHIPDDPEEHRHVFIETPCKKAVRYTFDYTVSVKPLDGDAENVADSHVRIDAKVWQDEVQKIDFDAMKSELLRWGAESVDIRIIRVPRENVRAEAVLKAESLRDKVQRMAELRGAEIGLSVLLKAEALETKPADELFSAITGREG
jgi:DNA repair exonuclease SbcCD nuclease subunit